MSLIINVSNIHTSTECFNKNYEFAENTQGKGYFPSEVQKLIEFLKRNDEYKPIQKQVVAKSPLIDWIWGLVLLSVLLATEWFKRKYNGLL